MAPVTITLADGTSPTIFASYARLSNIDSRTCSTYQSNINVNSYQFFNSIGFNTLYTNLVNSQSNFTQYVNSNFGTSSNDKDALYGYMMGVNRDITTLGFITNCVTDTVDTSASVADAQKQLDISKHRYEQLKSPETHVSYYEGTFPIYRPIKESTLFALFGFGLFLMLVALMCFLRTQGIQINVLFPQTSFSISGILSGQAKYIGIASVVGVVLGYFMHIYYKQ